MRNWVNMIKYEVHIVSFLLLKTSCLLPTCQIAMLIYCFKVELNMKDVHLRIPPRTDMFYQRSECIAPQSSTTAADYCHSLTWSSQSGQKPRTFTSFVCISSPIHSMFYKRYLSTMQPEPNTFKTVEKELQFCQPTPKLILAELTKSDRASGCRNGTGGTRYNTLQ